jgi:hypothetical protein
MPRRCTVCAHPDAILINEAIIRIGEHGKLSNRAITRQYDLSKDAVRRHREHIPEMLARASRAEEIARADSLLDRLEDLQRRTEGVLDEVEGTENYGAILSAIREMRRNLEVIGEVTKELNRAPALNLTLNPEYIELRTAILAAVVPHPEAAASISRAMLELENGHER